jgi:2-iminobutanoate/2-iminopropanoate deaminase
LAKATNIHSAGGTSAKGLIFVSGTVPSLNGTIVSGGIKNETVSLKPAQSRVASINFSKAQVIANIKAILEEGGSSLKYILKTTVFLANISDFAAMNEVYSSLLPSPKPARTTIQVGKLPGNFSIEIEATAAIPEF